MVGYHGVTVFFVLSGFLIYQSAMGRPVPVARFVRRRIRRIYPTFLVVLALRIAFGVLLPSFDRVPAEGSLLYLAQNALLLPGVFPIAPIVPVAWSLSYEICFYLGVATVVGVLGLRRWPWKVRVLLVAALFVALLGTPGLTLRTRTFALFAPGILLYELTRSAPAAAPPARSTTTWPRIPSWVVAGAFVLAIVAAPAVTGAFARSHLPLRSFASAALTLSMLSVGITLLLYEGTTSPGAVAALLARRPLRALGVISYSFYLVHGLAIKAVSIAFWRLVGSSGVAWGGPALYVALLVPVYVICAAAALALFKLVEARFSL
jgi:peptidoglycan/LPS O-acetylase OafA/YrhL